MGKLKIGVAARALAAALLLLTLSTGAAAAAEGRLITEAGVRGMPAAMSLATNFVAMTSERADSGNHGQAREAADAADTGRAAADAGMAGMDHGQPPGGGTETFGFAAAKVLSLLAAGIAVIYYTLRIRWMRSAPRMHLMMASMTLAMAAGLTGGTLLALVTASFSLSAMAAAAACAAAGYMAGSPHGVLPSLEGALAGFMGGLMGGMMGYMSLGDHPVAVLAFVDASLAAAAVLLSRLLRECSVLLAAAEPKEQWHDEEGESFEERLVQKFVGD
ncbi:MULTISPECIES: hypothetical protein [unclassified Paenibacillus]|uniref:hypothetical protein n=1 Tax=unclassified Paenibacillus TaxID=185978 RepID=UPI0009573548|nr:MULTISPECIES: hypothetical protein [unclassified Paenibacillus]ASS65761.1 hypothetical protein CIC07_06105 [Paenibacillus sp. RUD330]SIQ24781.1 hypothetical protein SAMN05880555_1138 [Paenibacillus sp. RU4X]SIQ46571.1 hypothetical protein SAMN05880570_1137 [Paenibacillus sp. RU4T]